MIKILFVRSENAFLPEIDAYIKHFNNTQKFEAFDSSTIKEGFQVEDYDVIWEFKGIGGLKITNQVLIHEYASLSTGALPKLKNHLKTIINYKPNLRLFLNEDVKEGFNFNDGVEYCFRDMGIDESFFQVKEKQKDYEFVYVGSISKKREIHKLLNAISSKKAGKILLVGNVDDEIYNIYKNNKDITFTGKVKYQEVPEIASSAEYGINYIPDRYPFNKQTSTKLLEYLALGLKVITTNYKWVREFEQRNNCSFLKLNPNNFDLDDYDKFNFISKINTNDFLWDSVIEKSGVTKKIEEIIHKIK